MRTDSQTDVSISCTTGCQVPRLHPRTKSAKPGIITTPIGNPNQTKEPNHWLNPTSCCCTFCKFAPLWLDVHVDIGDGCAIEKKNSEVVFLYQHPHIKFALVGGTTKPKQRQTMKLWALRVEVVDSTLRPAESLPHISQRREGSLSLLPPLLLLHPGLDHRNCPITHTPGSFIGLTQDIPLPAPPIPASILDVVRRS